MFSRLASGPRLHSLAQYQAAQTTNDGLPQRWLLLRYNRPSKANCPVAKSPELSLLLFIGGRSLFNIPFLQSSIASVYSLHERYLEYYAGSSTDFGRRLWFDLICSVECSPHHPCLALENSPNLSTPLKGQAAALRPWQTSQNRRSRCNNGSHGVESEDTNTRRTQRDTKRNDATS